MKDESVTRFERSLFIFIVATLFFIGGLIVGHFVIPNKCVPVDNKIIDSLTQVNDSIKIKIEKLDSIKNAKVIEVSTLDNDSTLKLFYELVSE